MSGARAWLPPDTCFGKVDRHIATIVREWSRAWFGDSDVEISAGTAMLETAWSTGEPQRCGSGAWLIASSGTTTALGRRALHLDSSTHETPADRTALDTVGEECLAALRRALVPEAELNGTASAEETSGRLALAAGTVWRIDCKRAPVQLSFVLSQVERIELLLRLLPPPPARAGLISPATALAPLEIQLAAKLGSCTVKLSELRSLSPGDVLVLDRDLSAASPLAVNGAPASGGSCTVSREAETLLLEIVEPIIGRIT